MRLKNFWENQNRAAPWKQAYPEAVQQTQALNIGVVP